MRDKVDDRFSIKKFLLLLTYCEISWNMKHKSTDNSHSNIPLLNLTFHYQFQTCICDNVRSYQVLKIRVNFNIRLIMSIFLIFAEIVGKKNRFLAA